MSVANSTIKTAITKLIKQYKNGKHTGNISDCPLCVTVGMTWYGDRRIYCINCPNAAFANKTMTALPCNARGMKYRKLEFDNDNDERMADFWKEVYAIIPSGRKKFQMTDELKSSIIEIARKINRKKYD